MAIANWMLFIRFTNENANALMIFFCVDGIKIKMYSCYILFILLLFKLLVRICLFIGVNKYFVFLQLNSMHLNVFIQLSSNCSAWDAHRTIHCDRTKENQTNTTPRNNREKRNTSTANNGPLLGERLTDSCDEWFLFLSHRSYFAFFFSYSFPFFFFSSHSKLWSTYEFSRNRNQFQF